MMKITKTILWGLLAAAWLSGANAWAQANSHEQGAMSVRKLDDGLYYMEYVREPVKVEKEIVYRDSLVYRNRVVKEDIYIEKELTF